ncbi:hypothetical protein ACQY1H_01110 [Agrobacterium vitis]|uniref:hypothetical protein n=1 Tax=Agrobacterium vitis TaxID=373 RepID=UPI003D29AB64
MRITGFNILKVAVDGLPQFHAAIPNFGNQELCPSRNPEHFALIENAVEQRGRKDKLTERLGVVYRMSLDREGVQRHLYRQICREV